MFYRQKRGRPVALRPIHRRKQLKTAVLVTLTTMLSVAGYVGCSASDHAAPGSPTKKATSVAASGSGVTSFFGSTLAKIWGDDKAPAEAKSPRVKDRPKKLTTKKKLATKKKPARKWSRAKVTKKKMHKPARWTKKRASTKSYHRSAKSSHVGKAKRHVAKPRKIAGKKSRAHVRKHRKARAKARHS